MSLWFMDVYGRYTYLQQMALMESKRLCSWMVQYQSQSIGDVSVAMTQEPI